jgi:hypothetical protein
MEIWAWKKERRDNNGESFAVYAAKKKGSQEIMESGNLPGLAKLIIESAGAGGPGALEIHFCPPPGFEMPNPLDIRKCAPINEREQDQLLKELGLELQEA